MDESRWNDTRLRLLAGDLTQVSVDVVMTAANQALAGGGGVDGAIHAAAGPTVMAELRERYDGCPTGSAVITNAGNLPAQYIVHAVGSIWRGGDSGEADLLASAYSSALDLAEEHAARSVAFPAISCGVYGYPLEAAAVVALGSIRTWLATQRQTSIGDIIFVLRGDPVMAAFRKALQVRTAPQAQPR